ncbi:helix-turn-helix domain-containing protein [Epilithonimonas vandammei]|nr:helix-turn-helix transcriptional regulator [Epilithonimonas vandammei]
MKIGDKLRKLRGNIPQTRIAQELEISQTAYNKWESNKSNPKISNLIKLSKFYNKDLYDLLGNDNKIDFYNSEINVQNLIKDNDVINQDLPKKYITACEKRINDLEKEVNFWKEKYNDVFILLKNQTQ